MVAMLAIDIGNTTISMGIVKGKRILWTGRLDIGVPNKVFVKNLDRCVSRIKTEKYNIADAVICSVVPRLTGIVQKRIKKILKVPVDVVGIDIVVPIKNNYKQKKQVGADRLIGAYAVKELYGQPAIIVDFGTAITFDVLNEQGEYDGGMIVPGIRLSIESLFTKTALLPQIDTIKVPRSLVGKNTKSSILSGIFYGYGAMCSGLIDQITAQFRTKPKVVVTGGYTHLMKQFMAPKITKIDKNLVFKGLALLQQHHSRAHSNRK